MAERESVVVDYMGIGDTQAERKAEERGKLMKPMAAHAMPSEQGFARGVPISESEHDVARPLLNLGTGGVHNALPPQISYRVPNIPWAGVRVEDVEKGSAGGRMVTDGRSGEGKVVEEMSASEIANLSGEDCRRIMLQMIKGGAGASASKPPTAQPKALLGMSPGEAKMRTWALSSRNGQPEAIPMQQLGVEAGRYPGNLTMRFQPQRFALQPFSAGEAHDGARPSERAVPEPSLSLSIPSAQDQSVAQPAPQFLRMIRQPELNRSHQVPTQVGQAAGPQTGAVSRSASQTHLPGRPPTAQLTIFYSGKANVYDDVPADKAEAIMLLAGSGNSWSSNVMNPNIMNPNIMNPLQPVRPAGLGALAALPQSLPASVPSVTPIGPALQAGPSVSYPSTREMPQAVKLPQARKKSLARFFENRKDRSRARSPYSKPEGSAKRSGETSNPGGRDKSPSPGSVKAPTRSPSPAQAVSGVVIKRSPSPAPKAAVF